MYRVMFVCHGNICRSPLAEFLFRDMLDKQGISGVKVSSCAVTEEEIFNGVGSPVYPPVARILNARGIDCSHKRAVLLTAADGDNYDVFLCMDDSNVRRAKAILGGRNSHKVVKLLSYAGSDANVADPWYTRDFNGCLRDIEIALRHLLARIKADGLI